MFFHTPDVLLTLLKQLVRTCHFLFVQQDQSADGEVEFSRVLKNTAIHPSVLPTQHKRCYTDNSEKPFCKLFWDSR